MKASWKFRLGRLGGVTQRLASPREGAAAWLDVADAGSEGHTG